MVAICLVAPPLQFEVGDEGKLELMFEVSKMKSSKERQVRITTLRHQYWLHVTIPNLITTYPSHD
jgi:hypothetical protein